MAAKKLKPVSIDGIEFDALISEDRSYQQDIPDYPTEEGFSVSDTIILKPITLNLVLYISNTPITWRKSHGISKGRVNAVCNKLEKMYFSRKLVKVVTPDAIYTTMGITSMQISKSKELSNTRQVTISLKKVYTSKTKTAKVPAYILKSGETKKNAGKASTSTTSKKVSASSRSSSLSKSSYRKTSSSSSGSSSNSSSGGANNRTSGNSSKSSGSKSKSSSKKSQSILYGALSKYL